MSRNGGGSQMDVYANTFIPQWLRDIQETPAQLVWATAATDFEVPFQEYIRTFAGSLFLPDRDLDSGPAEAAVEVPARSISVDALPQPQSYSSVFHRALVDEFQALQSSQNAFNMYKIRLNSTVPDQFGTFITASIIVPGLRENSPFVRLGDTIVLRPLFLDEFGHPLSFQHLHGQSAYFFRVRGWAGCEFQAIVTSINRHQEIINLKIDNLEAFVSNGCLGAFNVSFPIRSTWATSQYASVQGISKILKQFNPQISPTSQIKDTQARWIKQMLFPEPSDGRLQETLNSAEYEFKRFNTLLNFEQMKAVGSVFRNNYGDLPFLISGPPGTGKTMTTVECVLQLVMHGKGKVRHIIVCAPSDPAADTLALRLKQHLQLPSDLFRLNSPSRTFAEVPESLMPYCYVENRCFGLPPFSHLMRCRVVVTTCRDADILVRARLTNHDLYELERNLAATLHPEEEPRSLALHWDAVFIDEAAQATEPEALISITVVSPPENYSGTKLPQVIMAGDHKQLGPRTASATGIIKISLFERLLERPAYSQHTLARHRIGRRTSIQVLTQAMLPILRPPFCDLIRNYRSHPAILAIPNSLFYHDTLLAEAADTESLLSWPGWKGKGWPVLFSCNIGHDELEQDGGGWYNVKEAKGACLYAMSFWQSGLIRQEDICVMSPFQAQVRCLRITFRNAGIGQVNIGPMEAFQGLESRLVIICTTRSRNRFMEQDALRGLGIVNEPKRFNVALTRAKQGLIVIGNPELLSGDTSWVAFLEFCRRNKLWDRPDPSDPVKDSLHWYPPELKKENPSKLPALEKLLLNSGQEEPENRQLGTIMTYDDPMWARGLHDALPTEEDDGDEFRGESALFDEQVINEDEDEDSEKENIKIKPMANGAEKRSWANVAKINAFRPQASTR